MSTAPATRIVSDAEALAAARALAVSFAAGAAARDRDRILPAAEIDAFSQSGLWAITVPASHGGADLSAVTMAEVIAIISAADPSIGQIPQNHFAAVEKLRLYANPEQQRRLFADIMAGARLGNATAEPGDRNPNAHGTRLHRDGDGYRLSGRKIYCTGALFAHWVTVACRDDEGRTWTAYVPQGTDGLTVLDDWSGFGQRTTASGTVILEDVQIPAGQVVPARPGMPKRDAAAAVTHLIHAAIDLGIARAVLDETIRLLRSLAHPARGSGVDEAVQDPLALRDVGELVVRLHAAELLVELAARRTDAARADDGGEATAAAALLAVIEAKIATTEVALAAANKLFELAGTQSTLARHNLDRHWRNARTHTLHDGVRWKYHAVGNFAVNRLLADGWTLGHPYTAAPG
jgi:SfnB family sulfur acquisition oxidoreductase